MKVAILAGSQSFSYDQGMHDFTIEEVNDIEEALKKLMKLAQKCHEM